MRFMEVWALVALAYWTVMLIQTLRARRWMLKLPAPGDNGPAVDKEQTGWAGRGVASAEPLVSVIIAAKEEESSIVETVQHLLNQSYRRIEIIAVNDRSRDATGRKLDELRRWSAPKDTIPIPLRVIHITTLPAGWLGKNHALYHGYQQARGAYLLFTDADVRFQRHAIRDALAYMQRQQADHVTLAPRMVCRTFWLRAFVHMFFLCFSLFVRPWRANDDFQHRHGMGVGAFNLISRAAYERIGTHRAIALRPDDDLQLGMKVKQARLRQRLLSGEEHIAVEWYGTLREAVRGLEKNMYSGFGYSLPLAAAGCAGLLALFIWPPLGMLTAGGLASALFALSVAALLAVYVLLTRSILGRSGKEAFVFPLSAGALCFVVARSVWLTLRQGGIYWRGTFYSLKELKRISRSS